MQHALQVALINESMSLTEAQVVSRELPLVIVR